MKIDKYLKKLQVIQLDTFGFLHTSIHTSVYDDVTQAVHMSVNEYDYDHVKEKTGDYEIKTFDVYTFFDKEENDAVIEKLLEYINQQREKYEATR